MQRNPTLPPHSSWPSNRTSRDVHVGKKTSPHSIACGQVKANPGVAVHTWIKRAERIGDCCTEVCTVLPVYNQLA